MKRQFKVEGVELEMFKLTNKDSCFRSKLPDEWWVQLKIKQPGLALVAHEKVFEKKAEARAHYDRLVQGLDR